MTLRVYGRADSSEVWNRYMDTRRWHEWSPQIRSVDTSDGPMVVPGLTGAVHSFAGPAVRFRVIDVDESTRTWTWLVRMGPIRMILEHVVAGLGAGSATSLRLRGPAPIIAGYAPLAYFALRRLVHP
ncbi:MAG: hypothetical protein JWN95_3819 [Frankiales bacterium]|nr:hypothetical protein [Frankiales bacterium]